MRTVWSLENIRVCLLLLFPLFFHHSPSICFVPLLLPPRYFVPLRCRLTFTRESHPPSRVNAVDKWYLLVSTSIGSAMRSQTSGFVRARLSQMQRRRETKVATTAKIFEVASDSSDSFPLALSAPSSYLMAHMTKSKTDTLTRKVKGGTFVLK